MPPKTTTPQEDPFRPVTWQNYYRRLGLEVNVHTETLALQFPSVNQVREAWRRKVAEDHPDLHPEEERAEWEGSFRRLMEAALTLIDPVTRGRYHDTLQSGKPSEGHKRWMESPERQPFVGDIDDWIIILVQDSIASALDRRGEYEDVIAARHAADLTHLPKFIPGERVAVLDEVDALAVVREVLEEKGEHLLPLRLFLAGRPTGLAITWRSSAAKSCDRVVLGKARKVSDVNRARMPGLDNAKPYGEIELALDCWLMMDAEQRKRVVFHELCHFEVVGSSAKKLKTVPHVVEAFPEEVAAYGIWTEAQAQLVAEALQHSSTADRLEQFGVLSDGQMVLFRDYFDGARALDKTSARPGETPADTARRASATARDGLLATG